MREIKFRAWDKEKKIMCGGFGHCRAFNSQEIVEGINGIGKIMLKPNIILMQYTGLEDIKGNEIWESDIVNIKHPQDLCGDFKNTNGRVFWYEDHGCWVHGNMSGRPPKRMWEYCEVIGNIYEHSHLLDENPELLTK